jgi:hypothetical protein
MSVDKFPSLVPYSTRPSGPVLVLSDGDVNHHKYDTCRLSCMHIIYVLGWRLQKLQFPDIVRTPDKPTNM